MILERPTGSYLEVLPKGPSDPTSVVYTISSTEPPRSALNYSQIPTGIEIRKRDTSLQNLPALRRANRGVLVYTTKDSRASNSQVGNQLFYSGQIFDFTTTVAPLAVTVDSGMDTQHDQHYIDGYSIGLDSADIASMSDGAATAQIQLMSELQTLQQQQDNLQVYIISQQKIINEASRTITGLDAILETSPGNQPIIVAKTKIAQAKAAATAASNRALEQLNALPAQIQIKQDQLRSLAALID